MPKASELKKGTIVDIDGAPHLVRQVEAKSPSSRGASTLYKVRFTNLLSKQKRDESYKGDDMLKDADCQRMPVQFSYMDGDDFVFMNLEDYSQYPLHKESVGDASEFMVEGLEDITALLVDGQLLAVELPPSVELEIVETAPAIKGATATGRTKPATLTTGVEVQVPEYLEPGERIKINTVTGKFMSRA